jgi:hemoglobin
MKRRLTTRDDIRFLVETFYGQVREDDLIGPIFNAIISKWDEHFEQLTDFWEANLLFVRAYQGNPVETHIQVDRRNDGKITPEHFGRWLQLWFTTLDEHFEGEEVAIAKNRARNMSTHLFMKIYAARAGA